MLSGVAGAALANACAHPVLAERARELGGVEIVAKCCQRRRVDGDRVRISWVVETVMERLNHRARLADGDVKEEGGAAYGSGKTRQFFKDASLLAT